MDSSPLSPRSSFTLSAVLCALAVAACSSTFTPEPSPTGDSGNGASGGGTGSGSGTEEPAGVSLDNAYFVATDSSLVVTFTFDVPSGLRVDRADRLELSLDSGPLSVSEDFCFARFVTSGRSKTVTITLEPDRFGSNSGGIKCTLTDSYGCGADTTKAFVCPQGLSVGSSVGITVGGLYDDGSAWSVSATAVPR